ncbi:hypothetical protein [Microcoleus sp. PH2017_28_MFU_U_A]|nr:hypothetical protein [Microcoleus sp. PH2017_28_MFU_U_A]
MIDKIDFASAIGAASNAVPAAHALSDSQSCSIKAFLWDRFVMT